MQINSTLPSRYVGMNHDITTYTLLPILRFVLDEKFQRNASKFAIFDLYENPKLLFPFFISCYVLYIFTSRNGKRKKQLWVFVYLYQICHILKRFAGTFCRAQTLNLGGVYNVHTQVVEVSTQIFQATGWLCSSLLCWLQKKNNKISLSNIGIYKIHHNYCTVTRDLVGNIILSGLRKLA